jgi:hypothetical protein
LKRRLAFAVRRCRRRAAGDAPPPASSQTVPASARLGFRVDITSVLFGVESAGPNQFTVRLADYDAGTPARNARVTLRFLAIDDPAVAATSLTLQETSADDYAGSGANLAFDGRWRVTVQVQRGSSSVDVPLDVEVTQPPLPVEVQRIPGAVNYDALVRAGGFVRFSLDPERAGPSRLFVGVFDMIQDERDATHRRHAGVRVSAASALVLKRLSAGRSLPTSTCLPGRTRSRPSRMRWTVREYVPGWRFRSRVISVTRNFIAFCISRG